MKDLEQIAAEAVSDAGEWKLKCRDLERELAALKAQPSGAVLDRQEAVNALYHFISGPGDCHAAARRVFDAGYRLNQPASAGDERAAFEAWYLGHFYMGDKHCGLEWLSTEPCGGYRHQHPAEQWIVWQARAALSANHSEQVRAVPVECRKLLSDIEQFFEGAGVSPGPEIELRMAAMLAAAPSAGSQGGDV